MKLVEEGKLLEAAERFAAIEGYEDAAAQAQAAYYALAQATRQEGRSLQAARYFELAGTYEDAAQQAEAIYDERYLDVSRQAEQAMQSGEYALAFTLLDTTDLTDLPKKYADLPKTRQEAAWLEAERLMEAGLPYEALPYYRAVPDYKKSAERMNSLCYKIIGTWQAKNGDYYVFNEDGTCRMADKELYFSVDKYTMSTGESKEEMRITHRIASVNGNGAVLYDLSDGAAKTIGLARAEQPQAMPQPTQEPESMEVVDE
jgi:tetratricopeptide (TPR) repeat protein